MKPTTPNRELISALADGQLAEEDFASVLATCETDEDALSSWSDYHLIGDVLRSPALAHASDAAFMTGLRARLAQEPGLGARDSLAGRGPVATPVNLPGRGDGREAANDSNFRWKLVAGFASMAAVATMGWHAGSGLLSTPTASQLARSEPSRQVLVMSEQGPIVRDARMQELLAEHKQFGATSALQMPSGFLRNATFESPQDERR